MRASRFVNHGGNEEPRHQRAVGVGRNDTGLDDFFGHDNYFARGAGAIYRDAQAAPQMGVALRVGALHVQDRDIGTQRAHRDQSLFADRRSELAQVAVFLQQVAAQRGVSGHEWNAHGARMQRQRDGEIRIVDDF